MNPNTSHACATPVPAKLNFPLTELAKKLSAHIADSRRSFTKCMSLLLSRKDTSSAASSPTFARKPSNY